ncbi:MAG: ATP-binding protein [Pedobacter sp.]|nr:MAG: ATP-binding protein [Pedobacter sp.]
MECSDDREALAVAKLQGSIIPADTVSKPATIGIAFNLPEAMPYISCLRKTICQLLKAAGISQQEIDDLEVVIGELATNAARHAQGGNYHVLFELQGNEALVTVTDNGVGFDMKYAVKPDAPHARI